MAQEGVLDALVVIRRVDGRQPSFFARLLGSFDAIAAIEGAARVEQSEELNNSRAKHDGSSDDVDVVIDQIVNVITLQRVIECFGESRVHDNRGQSKKEKKNVADDAHDDDNQTALSIEENKETHDDFHCNDNDDHDSRRDYLFDDQFEDF